jgi:hypothetical protein
MLNDNKSNYSHIQWHTQILSFAAESGEHSIADTSIIGKMQVVAHKFMASRLRG